MRWEGQRESQNVEDRRAGGARRAGGIGLGSVVIALALGWLLGINPLSILGVMENVQQTTVQEEPAQPIPVDDKQGRFVSTMLASTEDVWTKVFAADGKRYTAPKLVLFRGAYPTACG
ncbi:MAG: neutral zinc metallopeptidase, partial [Saezia sp.]